MRDDSGNPNRPMDCSSFPIPAMEAISQCERINVVGTSGSGKSTFGRTLAGLLTLPFYELDQMYWQPGWQPSSEDELIQKVRQVTSQPRWVLDGNYTRTIPDKWRQVQLVIWLDLSFPRTVFRVTKRTIHRAFTRQELWPGTGNRETFTSGFLSPKSIIWWAITTHRVNRNRYTELAASPTYSHIPFVRLSSPAMVTTFLRDLRRVVGGSETRASFEANLVSPPPISVGD